LQERFAIAFSSEVETASGEENASKQEFRVFTFSGKTLETIKGADGLARAPSMSRLMLIVRATGADHVGAERISASRSN
jgi:hypothetical protein